jgi:hypothetical protein
LDAAVVDVNPKHLALPKSVRAADVGNIPALLLAVGRIVFPKIKVPLTHLPILLGVVAVFYVTTIITACPPVIDTPVVSSAVTVVNPAPKY